MHQWTRQAFNVLLVLQNPTSKMQPCILVREVQVFLTVHCKFHHVTNSCQNNNIINWTHGFVCSHLHLGLVAILDSSINSRYERKLTFALLKFILAPSTSSSGINFFLIFAYAECLYWHSHRQWLQLGFSHNVNKATEKDYLELPAADCWALTDMCPLWDFPALLLPFI